jgi:hypothetical protein
VQLRCGSRDDLHRAFDAPVSEPDQAWILQGNQEGFLTWFEMTVSIAGENANECFGLLRMTDLVGWSEGK